MNKNANFDFWIIFYTIQKTRKFFGQNLVQTNQFLCDKIFM